MSRAPRRRQRTRVVAAVVAVAVLAVTALTLVAGGDGSGRDREERASDATTTTVPATTTTLDRESLGAAAQELLALVDQGRAATFHARYSLSSAELGDGAATAELEVWRQADRVRQDTTVADASGVVHTSAFGDATGTVGCREEPTGWQCQRVTAEAFDPAQDFVAGVLEQLADAEVTATSTTLGPYQARCFTFTGTGPAELCLSPAGIPLRVDAGGVRYDILDLSETVSDADFVPPAPVPAS